MARRACGPTHPSASCDALAYPTRTDSTSALALGSGRRREPDVGRHPQQRTLRRHGTGDMTRAASILGMPRRCAKPGTPPSMPHSWRVLPISRDAALNLIHYPQRPASTRRRRRTSDPKRHSLAPQIYDAGCRKVIDKFHSANTPMRQFVDQTKHDYICLRPLLAGFSASMTPAMNTKLLLVGKPGTAAAAAAMGDISHNLNGTRAAVKDHRVHSVIHGSSVTGHRQSARRRCKDVGIGSAVKTDPLNSAN